MLTANQISEILTRHARGEGALKIAKAMGISSQTVKRYFHLPLEELAQRLGGRSIQRPSQLDPHKDDIKEGYERLGGNCVALQAYLAERGISVKLRTLEWYCQTKLHCGRS